MDGDRAMIEILWQYDPQAAQRQMPTTAGAAREELTNGNRAFAEILSRAAAGAPTERTIVRLAARDLGLPAAGDAAPEQLPFAAVLSCADARVPVEMIFWQEANDLFVVRVAGNTVGDQSMGSLDYAVNHLPTLQLLVVLGHTSCGAATAAVNAFLAPASYIGLTADLPLRSIVDSIMTAVAGAADALVQVYGESVRSKPGFRTALVELTVIINAALTAAAVRQIFRPKLGGQLDVVYGVFNLQNHMVGKPDTSSAAGAWQSGLWAAPQAAADFTALALEMARSQYVAGFLG